ncbi:MAG: SurA N-terminal domain-containing protein [Muribaculaceae bacterium]|nr:SurA N-terminal domain-containing protein [Muribaculaceae bacterium]
MATLEKIRSKSVFLIVVIGLALLAFIVGDALTNSRNIFGEHTTIAKVGKTKIDITDYQRKREELNRQLEEARRQNPAQFANFDTQVLSQMALDQLIQEEVVLAAADKAGIRTTGNLLRYYMIENPQNQQVIDIVRQLNNAGLSVQTPQQAYEVIFNPKRNGLTDAQVEPYQRLWLAAEKEMKETVKGTVYQRILAGTVKANDLDKKALYNDYITTSNVEVAYLPYGNLDAKEYPVSDDELKKQYNEKKGLFKVAEPTKDISFLSVSIGASAADRAAARQLAQNTVKELSDSLGQLSKATKKEGVSLTHHALRSTDLPAGAVKEFVTTAAPGEVKIISETVQGFTVVRNSKTTTAVDSIQLNLVTVASEGLGNKIMAQLNEGLSADSIMSRFSADSVATQLNQWIPLYTAQGATNAIPQETLDSLRNAGGKYVPIQSGAQGMLIAKIVEQKSPKTIYEFDEAEYMLGPSVKTVNDERAKLEKFLLDNKTAADFVKNAEKAGYAIQNFSVTQSTPAVPRMMGMNSYYPDSRQVIRWVMIDGKDGEVSHIYESKNALTPALYAVAIDRSYDEYVPVSNPDVNSIVAQQVRASKAGDKMVEKYGKNTKSIAEAAKAMGVEPRNLASFRFGHNVSVADPSVMGRIAGSKADKKVAIVKGEDGVYVYQVSGNATENFPFSDQSYEQQYYQLVNPNLMQMITGDKKVKNNIYKFEAGD